MGVTMLQLVTAMSLSGEGCRKIGSGVLHGTGNVGNIHIFFKRACGLKVSNFFFSHEVNRDVETENNRIKL